MCCGRRAAVMLGGLLSRLGRRACGSPPRRLLCGVRRRRARCLLQSRNYLPIRCATCGVDELSLHLTTR